MVTKLDAETIAREPKPTPAPPPVLTESEKRLMAQVADLSRRLAKESEQVKVAWSLIGAMDANRETLGDACRVCRERIWSGPNGERRPHHTPDCPVRAVAEGVGLKAIDGRVVPDRRG